MIKIGWVIAVWIESLILIALNLLLKDWKTVYSPIGPWQSAFLITLVGKGFSNIFYSIGLGLSFTALNFISAFTTHIYSDNNFLRNQGFVFMFFIIYISIVAVLTFLDIHRRVRNIFW